jgi:YmgG-like glycine-zipper protein
MYKKLLIIPAALFAFACSGNDKKVDDALNADLAMAGQASPYSPLDSITAAERAGVAGSALTSTATAPRRTTPVRRTATRRSSAPVYRAPAPAPTRVVKHTKRDAAIGAVAGGVLGAATSRNKVKGAIIGATAGAIIGGVIGNNVDVERR